MIHRILHTNEDGTTIVESKPCFICGVVKNHQLDTDRLYEWVNGRVVQECFPEMPEYDRDNLINGICKKHWDEIFPPGKDE